MAATQYEVTITSPNGFKARLPLWVNARSKSQILSAMRTRGPELADVSEELGKDWQWDTARKAWTCGAWYSPGMWIVTTERTRGEAERTPLPIMPKNEVVA